MISYAWVAVAVCAAMVAMAFGAIVNIAVFLTPLAAEFGWPRAELSFAYSIATIGTGLGGVLMGHFSDRLPVRRVALCGALVPGTSFLFLSGLQSSAELYLYHALMGFFGLGAIMAPMNNLAGLWLARNPGLAIGIVSAGGALGQGLTPFFARHLVLIGGWREAYLTLGVIYLAVMVPLALLLRDPPGRAAGGARTPVMANPYALPRPALLALLSLAVVMCCICMATPIVHVAALGADFGLGGREAAGLLTVMMMFGIAGRVLIGALSGRLGALQVYMISSFGQTALAFLFPFMTTKAELYVLSALFGLVFSGAMTAFLLCARQYAPEGSTGLAIGSVSLFAWTGMALGAWQGGLFYDLCGSYVVSFSNASAGGVVNLLILAVLYRYTVQRPRRLTEAKGLA